MDELVERRASVNKEAFDDVVKARLTGRLSGYALVFDEYLAVASVVRDWENKESCRQTVEEWVASGPHVGALGVPAAFYSRYEDNPPHAEYLKLKSRMNEIEARHPEIGLVLEEAEAAGKAAGKVFWEKHVPDILKQGLV